MNRFTGILCFGLALLVVGCGGETTSVPVTDAQAPPPGKAASNAKTIGTPSKTSVQAVD